jgi:hypothetical protein
MKRKMRRVSLRKRETMTAKPPSNEQSWQGIMANNFLREREELLDAAQVLASYTLGFSENESVAQAKETVERIRGNRDDIKRARATSQNAEA